MGYLQDLHERGRALATVDRVSIGARIRVYRRDPDGGCSPGELLPTVYGGLYDPGYRCYVGQPTKCSELSVNPIYRDVATSTERRVLLLGAPGSGKTEQIVVQAVLNCLTYPAKPGGFVAPVASKLDVGYGKFIKLVQPKGWVKRTQSAARGRVQEVQLINDAVVQFVAAKKHAKDATSPIAGFDWFWAVEDEQQGMDNAACGEVDARGRVNPKYRVFSSATNEPSHVFQTRVHAAENNKDTWRVFRLSGRENVFVHPSHWDNLRKTGNLSPSDFERIIECKDIPQDGRVYPEFSYSRNVGPAPQLRDVTAQITREKYGAPYDFVIGLDFGRRTTVAIILKAYADGRDRVWCALGEITTREKTTDWHAGELERWFQRQGVIAPQSSALIIGDPTINSSNKEADRSDYVLLRNRGWNAVRSAGGERIDRKHRYAMVNALLQDSTGKRRLTLLANEAGSAVCGKLSESLGNLMYAPNGEPETYGKHPDRDLTHWSDALGYALFPFERVRGRPPGGDLGGANGLGTPFQRSQ